MNIDSSDFQPDELAEIGSLKTSKGGRAISMSVLCLRSVQLAIVALWMVGCSDGADRHPSGANTAQTLFGFDTTSEGFAIRYSEPSTLQEASTLEWDGSVGNPASGSLMMLVPFTSTNQKIQVSTTIAETNYSGRAVLALIRLDSGLSTGTYYGGGKVYVKSTSNYIGAYGDWVDLNPVGEWKQVMIEVSNPDYTATTAVGTYDSTKIVEVGVEVASGTNGTFTSAVLHVDSFVLQ